MEILIAAVVLGLIPAVIAQKKGYSFLGWWIFGALLFIVALPVSLVIGPSEDTRRQCPHCMTWIDRAASVCPQCARDVPAAVDPQPQPRQEVATPIATTTELSSRQVTAGAVVGLLAVGAVIAALAR